jgi:hypothetical protein
MTMNAVQNAAPTANILPIPVILTIAVAVLALVAVAVYLRRARLAGRLDGITLTASGVSAAGIVASALLLSVTLGGMATASAEPATPASPAVGITSPPLTGYQLPTK